MNRAKKALTGFVFYALVPILLLILLVRPIENAVSRNEQAVFSIFFAALACVGLNWLIYKVIHRRRPTVLVFAHGTLCLLIISFMLYDRLQVYSGLGPILADISGVLALAVLLLLSFWFAARPSRPAHSAAVGFRIIYGLILFGLAWQIIRDIEIRIVTHETWIYTGILIAGILAFFSPKVLSAFRLAAFHRRANHVSIGRICQIIGETHLDMDDDPVTLCYALIQYTVDDTLYETHADISRYMIRKYGRDAFIGKAVSVFYDPADPAHAFTSRIDRHFFDLQYV